MSLKEEIQEDIKEAVRGKEELRSLVLRMVSAAIINKERKNLANNGYLEVTIIINNKGKAVKNPIISFKGLPIESQNDDFIFDLEEEVNKTSRTFSLNNTKQENILIEELKKKLQKISQRKNRQKTLYKY